MIKRTTHALLAVLILAALACAAPGDAKQLFNGKDMDGWKHVGPGSFTVEDGLLRSHGGMGLLYWTKEPFGNCTLHVVFKTTKADTNSGVFIRIDGPPKDEWYAVHHGYEVQVLDSGDDWHMTGAIYSISKATEHASKPAGEWNVMDITLDGPRTVVTLNGKKINDYTEGQPVPERKQWYEPERGRRVNAGYFGVQNHDDTSSVYFKEISVLPLKK